MAAVARAAAVVNRAAGWSDAAVPLFCVAAAAGVLAVEIGLDRRDRSARRGRERSKAVEALHRELDAVEGPAAVPPASGKSGRDRRE